ncbi:MAG TPA: Hpt domain-containing protein [Vicinamibacterales bacterium]|nr:Hpt domain-containing protein [Vicinamibacterales bacterium]
MIETLRSLTPPGEPDVLSEVLQLFLTEVPPRIDRLRNAWAAGNIEEVHRAAHSLKGSAGNIGANAFFEVCKELDEKSRSGQADAVGPLVDALGVEYGRVEVEIARLLGAS